MDEPLPVFADFGHACVLRKEDASAQFATLGVYDEAASEWQTERGTMSSKQPQISVPLVGSEAYGEGDQIDFNGFTFEILDATRDGTVSVFRVSKV